MSNVTGNTTQSFGIIKYVCNILYIMLIAQLEPKPWQSSHQSIIQRDNELTGQAFCTYLCTDLCFCQELPLWIQFSHTYRENKNQKYVLLYFNNTRSYFCTHITHTLGRDLVLLKNLCLILLERFLLPLQFNQHLQSPPEKH